MRVRSFLSNLMSLAAIWTVPAPAAASPFFSALRGPMAPATAPPITNSTAATARARSRAPELSEGR